MVCIAPTGQALTLPPYTVHCVYSVIGGKNTATDCKTPFTQSKNNSKQLLCRAETLFLHFFELHGAFDSGLLLFLGLCYEAYLHLL